MSNKLNICEAFTSVQGEGLRMGKPTYFIRVAGCNLHCPNCDTMYSFDAGEDKSIDKIVQEIPSEIKDVVITGGEPILPLRKEALIDLCQQLAISNKFITIETNATHYINHLHPYVGLWSLSPKLSSMGKRNTYNLDVITKYLDETPTSDIQLKFVVDPKKMDEVEEVIDNIFMSVMHQVPIILQPVDIQQTEDYGSRVKDSYLKLIDFGRGLNSKYNIYILPQMHKIFWGNERGV